jgi:hypothetical protein
MPVHWRQNKYVTVNLIENPAMWLYAKAIFHIFQWQRRNEILFAGLGRKSVVPG